MTVEDSDRDCPLCGSQARCRPAVAEGRSCFDCPRCGCFEISPRSEQVLMQAPRSWRESFSLRARQAPEGHKLAIGVPLPVQQGGAIVALAGNFVRIQEDTRRHGYRS